MTVASGIRFSRQMMEAMKNRAMKISLLRGQQVSWAQLVRECVEKELSLPEPKVQIIIER